MRVARAGALIAIALLTQAATITLTNENMPRSSPHPGLPAARPAVADGAAKLWLAAINRQRGQKGLPAVELDPVLSEAGRRQAELIASLPDDIRQQVSAKRLLEAFWQAGAIDGNPTWRVVSQGGKSVPGPWNSFRNGSLLDGDISHVGVGSAARDGSRWTVITIVKRRLQLAGMQPGLRRPYDRFYLRGRLSPGFSKPHLMLAGPDGKVKQMAISAREGQFEHLLELDAAIGRYMVEVMVEGRWGPSVGALFPVDVGTPFKPETVAASDESRLTLEQRRQRMLALINADRRKFNLPPVVLNEHLSRMAQGHSDDMKRNRYFAHTSPTTGSLENRMRQAHIPPMMVGENIAVSGSLAEAEDGLMGSPAHRSMILDPQMTVVGIGITTSDGGEPGPAKVWVTQNFGERAPQ